VHQRSYWLCKDNRLSIKVKLVIFYACVKSMLTMFYVLEHSGMCHLCVSFVFVIQLVVISISLFVSVKLH